MAGLRAEGTTRAACLCRCLILDGRSRHEIEVAHISAVRVLTEGPAPGGTAGLCGLGWLWLWL